MIKIILFSLAIILVGIVSIIGTVGAFGILYFGDVILIGIIIFLMIRKFKK